MQKVGELRRDTKFRVGLRRTPWLDAPSLVLMSFPWCNQSGIEQHRGGHHPAQISDKSSTDPRVAVMVSLLVVVGLAIAVRASCVVLKRRRRSSVSAGSGAAPGASSASASGSGEGFTAATLAFLFNYIAATIVAVSWEKIFCLSLGDDLCGTLPALAAFALVSTAAFPSIAWLFKLCIARTRSHRIKGLSLMLSTTFGFSVAVSYGNLLEAVATALCLDQDDHLPTAFFAMALAMVTTAVGVVLQSAILKCSRQRAALDAAAAASRKRRDASSTSSSPAPPCCGSCTKSWLSSFYDVMLGSFWTTIGYTWNTTWTKFQTYFYQAETSAESSAVRALMTVAIGTLVCLFVVHEPILNSEDGAAGGGTVTSSLSSSSPSCPRRAAGRRRRRVRCERLLVASKMSIIVTISYAVNDMSYHFAVTYLKDHNWSSAAYYFMLYLWAIFLTLVTVGLARWGGGWDAGPRDGSYCGRFKGFALLTSCWVASYAWWYPWNDNLDSITGFGISDAEDGTYPSAGIVLARLALALGLGFALSYVSAFLFVCLGKKLRARRRRKGTRQRDTAAATPLSTSTMPGQLGGLSEPLLDQQQEEKEPGSSERQDATDEKDKEDEGEEEEEQASNSSTVVTRSSSWASASSSVESADDFIALITGEFV